MSEHKAAHRLTISEVLDGLDHIVISVPDLSNREVYITLMEGGFYRVDLGITYDKKTKTLNCLTLKRKFKHFDDLQMLFRLFYDLELMINDEEYPLTNQPIALYPKPI